MSSENSWFRQNQIFFNYGMLGISAVYMGWVFSLPIPISIKWFLWFLNPLTIYGCVLMYLRREALYRAYDMFSALWGVRRYEKEHGVIELEDEEE